MTKAESQPLRKWNPQAAGRGLSFHDPDGPTGALLRALGDEPPKPSEHGFNLVDSIREFCPALWDEYSSFIARKKGQDDALGREEDKIRKRRDAGELDATAYVKARTQMLTRLDNAGQIESASIGWQILQDAWQELVGGLSSGELRWTAFRADGGVDQDVIVLDARLRPEVKDLWELSASELTIDGERFVGVRLERAINAAPSENEPEAVTPSVTPASPKLITLKAIRDAVNDARKADGPRFNQYGLAKKLKAEYPEDPLTFDALRRRIGRIVKPKPKTKTK